MPVILFVFVLGSLILVHESGHFIAAKRAGIRVEKFSIGFGPKVAGFKRGGTEYVISLLPLGGFVKLAGESVEDNPRGEPWEFLSQSVGVRARVISAGAAFNYLLGILLFSCVFMLGYPMPTTQVGEIIAGYPAAESPLRTGDRIERIDGARVGTWDELVALVQKKTSGGIDLVVRRGETDLSMTIVPRVSERTDLFGTTRRVAMLGISPSGESVSVRHGPFMSLWLGTRQAVELTGMTYRSLFSILTGRLSMKQAITGPVGIFVITGKAAAMGLVYLLRIMALLSTSLAIFNMLPIPVLDGGHLLFLVIERFRGRALSVRTQFFVTQAGLYLLIALMIFVSYTDLVRWGVFQKVAGFVRTLL